MTLSSKDRLTDDRAVERHLDQLLRIDPSLTAIRALIGPVSSRYAEPGFAGLAKIICGQQLSVASARAIWTRYSAIEGALDAVAYLTIDETKVRAAGMSTGKIATLRAVAAAIASGGLDLKQIDSLPPPEALQRLIAIKGIGPWSAELYLLFCAGHPDIFPTGDLALQKAVAHGLGLGTRILAPALITRAQQWAPYRGAAALLFWAYFAHLRDREGLIL